MSFHVSMSSVLWLVVAAFAASDALVEEAPPGFKITQLKTYRFKTIIRVAAPRTNLRRVTVTCPALVDWPSQKVELIEETKPRGVTTRVRKVAGIGAMQTITIPAIPAGGTVEITRLSKVQRYAVTFEHDPSTLTVPTRLPKAMRMHLSTAPGIDPNDEAIVSLRKELIQSEDKPWENVKRVSEWIRKNIEFKLGAYRGAKAALALKTGDCEDMCALFIALCRGAKIPARSVWIEGHAYPEFYLQDAKGQGYWIPVQLQGPNWFGEMHESLPIFQKGDSVKDQLQRRTVRYIPQTARALGGPAQLEIRHQIILDESR